MTNKQTEIDITSVTEYTVSNDQLELSHAKDIKEYVLPASTVEDNPSHVATSCEEMEESATALDTGTNEINTDQGFGGLSNRVNDTNVFPVGTYRKISEATSISGSSINQFDEVKDAIKAEVTYRKWAVLMASFFELFLCTGFSFNMSVLNLAFLEEFGKSKAETSLIQSVATGLFFIAGLPMGTAVGKYGVRTVGIVGGLLAFLGTFLSFFATNIYVLIVTVGLIQGVGSSACYISASTSVGEYFDGKSKLIALSFISFGSGCGAMLFPDLLDILSREFGWRGCLMIVSGLMANMIPCFSVCKPLKVGVSPPHVTCSDDRHYNGKQSFIQSWCLHRKQHKPDLNSRLSVVSTISTASMLHSHKEDGLLVKLKTLAANKVYLCFTLAMMIAIPAVNSVLIFLIVILQFKGFDRPTAVFLYFFMSTISTVFRMVPGLCKRIPHMSVLMIPVFYMGIGAVACALLPDAITYEQHLLLLGMLGTMLGGTVTVMSVTTMKLVGMKNYSTGLGVTVTAVGLSNTCAGPIAGYLRDTTGSYTLSFYGVSAGLIVAMCFYSLAAAMRKCNGDNAESIEKYLGNDRRRTRRRSSILPWKGKVEFIF